MLKLPLYLTQVAEFKYKLWLFELANKKVFQGSKQTGISCIQTLKTFKKM